MKIFLSQTLDGYIAGSGGSLEHLKPFEENDYGFETFAQTVDAFVMGRGTFDAFYPEFGWPHPPERPGVILTSRPLPDDVPEHVTARTDIDGIAADYPGAYVDGGQTIAQFLARGYVREAYIFTLPVRLGTGIPLFPKSPAGHETWFLVDIGSYPCGTVRSHYQIDPG